MTLIGIRRKRDKEIIATASPGVFISGSDLRALGEDHHTVEYVSIVVPEYGSFGQYSPDKDAIGNMARHLGMDISDFIEMCAKIFGIPMCSACQMTKLILYSVRTIGWLRAMKLIFKTRMGVAYSAKEQLVLDTLKKDFDTI